MTISAAHKENILLQPGIFEFIERAENVVVALPLTTNAVARPLELPILELVAVILDNAKLELVLIKCCLELNNEFVDVCL